VGLASIALANQLLFVVINIMLARQLSAQSFDRYCVAVSVTLTLSTISVLGLEKYALRYLPARLERGDAALVIGYWRFSHMAVVCASLALVAVFALAMSWSLLQTTEEPLLVILYLVVFLPAIGLCLLAIEMVTASGAAVSAAAVYRLVLPATLLLLIMALSLTSRRLTTMTALLAYGISWTIAGLLLRRMARARIPCLAEATIAVTEGRAWLRESLPFLVSSSLMMSLAQSGVMVLAFVAASDAVVGQYAVAAQIGTFVVSLATSTNRLYAPKVSLLMERRDRDSMIRLARERLVLTGGISALYVLVTITFGRHILGLFGAQFVAAYPALCWITVGAAVGAMFSGAPYYLQFAGRHVFVTWSTVLAVAASVLLCIALGHRLGSLGAAIAYAVPVGALFVTQRLVGFRHVRRHWESGGDRA